MITNLVILSTILTNFIQIIQLPIIPYNDYAYMYGHFTGDGTNLYGIRIEGLNAKSNVVIKSYVQEYYVPPMTETAGFFVPPTVKSIKCLVLGTNLEGKWSDGMFTLLIVPPTLKIYKNDTNIILDWFDPYRCWKLEKIKNQQWISSTNKMENIGNNIFRINNPYLKERDSLS